MRQVDDADPLIDRRLIQLFNHPIRVRLLELLGERLSLTPVEAIRLLEEESDRTELSDFAGHMQALIDLKMVELARTPGEKGGFAYRLSVGAFVDDSVWHRIPNDLRPAAWVAVLQAFTQASVSALQAGTIRRRESQFNLLPLALDEEGWRKVVGAFAELLFLVEEARQECVERAMTSPEGEAALSPALVALTLFETVPTQGDDVVA